jgi:hypothetical protein
LTLKNSSFEEMNSIESGIITFQEGLDFIVEITDCFFRDIRTLSKGGVLSVKPK